ncbi:MAG: hypothetical protein OXU86_06560 [Thaumarchaeota archaeon]|nr:hypothetical protein [Nitrososphaerota archaeon]
MEYLSAQFAKQARSDLGMAQAIAIANESGDALGTAMFLAQQSMEKQFKSALLMVGEAIEAGLEGKFVSGVLNHVIHHRPATFYQKCLEGIGRPVGLGLDDSTKTMLGQLEQIGKIWDPDSYDTQVQNLLFQYSLGVYLQPDLLDRLYSWLCSVFEKINKCDNSSEFPPIPFFNQGAPDSMDSIISDRQKLEQYRASSAAHPLHASERHVLERLYGKRLGQINQIANRRRLSPKATDRGDIMLQILEFGTFAVALHSPKYVYLVPHLVLGRYPAMLPTGQISTEVYASQRNMILYQLFVNVQYDHDRLCKVNEQIGRLCEAYREGWR